MEQGFLGTHLLLKQEQRTLEDQEEEVQRKLAVFRRKDGACVDVLRDFELHLYALVKRDRDDPRYRRYKKIPAAKTSWIDAYVKLHGAIRGVFLRDPGRVESYFLRFRKDRKKADEVTNGAAPQPPALPAPPAPPA